MEWCGGRPGCVVLHHLICRVSAPYVSESHLPVPGARINDDKRKIVQAWSDGPQTASYPTSSDLILSFTPAISMSRRTLRHELSSCEYKPPPPPFFRIPDSSSSSPSDGARLHRQLLYRPSCWPVASLRGWEANVKHGSSRVHGRGHRVADTVKIDISRLSGSCSRIFVQ